MPSSDLPRTSERLILRRPATTDLDDLAAIFADPEVNRFLYSEPRDRDTTRRILEQRVLQSASSDAEVLFVAVELRESSRVIGDFLLRWSDDEHRQGEVGGSLHPSHQGRGYATEVYRELLHVAFVNHGLHRVVGRLDARNRASAHSLEKAGLHQEAHLVENEFVKGEWTSEIVMAICREQWLAR